jgi:putative Ca2+/H+ antiporter (TMEM165/GDT1 family)
VNWVPLLATFGMIFIAELPDKTMMATLVLSSRYRALPVLLGVSAAFAVQSAIAVAAGGLLGLLPDWLVVSIVALLFAVGAVLLFRESMSADDDDDEVRARAGLGFWPTVFTSFGVLFAAEWGDASQLGTAALSAHYQAPVLVFLGATLALITVAALAVVLGRLVVRFVPLKWIQRGAAVLFGIFAVIALVELVRLLG